MVKMVYIHPCVNVNKMTGPSWEGGGGDPFSSFFGKNRGVLTVFVNWRLTFSA